MSSSDLTPVVAQSPPPPSALLPSSTSSDVSPSVVATPSTIRPVPATPISSLPPDSPPSPPDMSASYCSDLPLADKLSFPHLSQNPGTPLLLPTDKNPNTPDSPSNSSKNSPDPPCANVPPPGRGIGSTIFRGDQIDTIREKYGIDSKFELRLPLPSEHSECPPPPLASFTLDHLKAGLRFPIHPLLSAIARKFGIPLGQFTPNSIRIMISFIVLVTRLDVEPSVEFFHYLFLIRSSSDDAIYITSRGEAKFLQNPPKSHSEWRRRFFYISPSQGSWEFPLSWAWSLPEQEVPIESSLFSQALEQLNQRPYRLSLLPSSECVLSYYHLSPLSVDPPDNMSMLSSC